MKKTLVLFGLFLCLAFGYQVFASFYNVLPEENINESTNRGRIVKESLFSYSWVKNYGADTKKMDQVLKSIKDTNDSRFLYDNMVYIAEKWTGQTDQKLFVKNLNDNSLFIDEEKTGSTATIAGRCKEGTGFTCELLSKASFDSGTEYYIKMTSHKPFYINFCNQENYSYIAGQGCVQTHNFCANKTGLQQIKDMNGNAIPLDKQVCVCDAGFKLNTKQNKCLAEGSSCAVGDSYNPTAKLCVKIVKASVGGASECGADGTIGNNPQEHTKFSYPANVTDSTLEVVGRDSLGFVSTGNRTNNGKIYEWKGNNCKIQDDATKWRKFSCGAGDGYEKNSTQPNENDKDVYLSIRAMCGASYGSEDRTATLTIHYTEQ